MKIEPGWYPDPADGSRDRYWDGDAWATGAGASCGEVRTAASVTTPRGEVRTALPVTTTTPPPSAPLVAGGIGGLVVGWLLCAAGYLDGSGAGAPAVVVGAIVSVVGLVTLGVGVYRMASGIDHLVRLSAERET